MDVIETYLGELIAALGRLSRTEIRAVVDRIEVVWATGGTTFVIGDGGSASTASHMVNDLMKFSADIFFESCVNASSRPPGA